MKQLWPGALPGKTSKSRSSIPNNRHQKLEKRLSHYKCCNLRGFAGSWDSMNNRHPNVMTNQWKSTHWAPLGEIVEIRCVFWKTSKFWFFIPFSIDPEIYKNLQQIPKIKRKRCQGRRACTARGTKLDPGKVYGALRGVPPGTSRGSFLGLGPPQKIFLLCNCSRRLFITCLLHVGDMFDPLHPPTTNISWPQRNK